MIILLSISSDPPFLIIISFGMLLWELGYEKLPYEGWSIERISDHVLNGKREKLLFI